MTVCTVLYFGSLVNYIRKTPVQIVSYGIYHSISQNFWYFSHIVFNVSVTVNCFNYVFDWQISPKCPATACASGLLSSWTSKLVFKHVCWTIQWTLLLDRMLYKDTPIKFLKLDAAKILHKEINSVISHLCWSLFVLYWSYDKKDRKLDLLQANC